MRPSAPFLLLLLCTALETVHSTGSVPYISHDGDDEILSNNSYFDLSRKERRAGYGHRIECYTDIASCCSNLSGPDRGNWYFPSGEKLELDRGTLFYKPFHRRVVLFYFRSDMEYARAVSGIFRCDVETASTLDGSIPDARESVYVGLYAAGGGDVKVENISYSVEHHENSPCVTLTCVSTGGPATNITWTKNSVEVVLGKRVTVLSDPVAAKYTHTMTPTGRELEGLYQCTVSNNKPSEDSMQVRVSLNGNRMYRNSAQNDDNHYEDLSQYDDDNRSSSKNYYMYEESLQYDNDNRSSSKTIIEDSLQYDNDNRDSYYNRHMYEYDNDKENSLRNYDRDRTLIIGKGASTQFFQLHLKGAFTCSRFVREGTTQKARDIKKALKDKLTDFCMCKFEVQESKMNSFHCSVLSRNSVTFRAKAITPSERDMSLLRVSLEDWVYSAPTLHAGGLSLMVDSQCPVFVSPLNEIDYCAVQNSLLSDGRPTAATATGGLVALVSAAASLVTAIIATHY